MFANLCLMCFALSARFAPQEEKGKTLPLIKLYAVKGQVESELVVSLMIEI
ncbi:hypothetical protein VIBNISO65_860010 [Vibrio nigripulchritudo SO65]|nr:hypothetical protein VIBNIAM115_740012 [Vibrio nigripulchritudo AM115]CCN39860.1 hypothetical protein VIBNIFTn2_1140050 [Vibrio nigripulchritudo FTn2]CCN67471.1 hypothetical protein VIBNIPon4_790010 [Vibrio nigripulchritudo POn4]CCN79233.1 hypothetical protein VIBNISO65_860010 [Vibrio nigripulchritudo SO65]